MNGHSHLINRAEVRRKLIETAQDQRYYWKSIKTPRVSESTLDRIEIAVRLEISRITASLPSKGKTI